MRISRLFSGKFLDKVTKISETILHLHFWKRRYLRQHAILTKGYHQRSISEFAFNCFKRSKNCWKPFLSSKQCLSTRKNWVWQFQFFLSRQCKGGTTGYHQRILQRGDHRIPLTNFIKISEIAFNCFKRCTNCWKPFLPSKQCLSTRKNMGMTILIFFYQVQRGDHRIPATSLAKFQKLHSTVSNVLKIVKNHFFDQNNVLRLIKNWVSQFQFFLSTAKGGPRDTTKEFFQNFRNYIQLLQTF